MTSPRIFITTMLLVVLGTSLEAAPPQSFSPLVKAQREKVVHINTNPQSDDSFSDSPGFFPEPGGGIGSGFIVSSDGLVVTNHHMIEGAKYIRVTLENGDTHQAKVIGSDTRTDLALLKIRARNLSPVKFGNSNALEVGDWVMAIGNPLGLSYSVTVGIISAKGRNIFNDENVAYGEFLQTDAAINPGNSGGPLFNMEGEVIGVNSAISSRGQGIGFAVPSNLVVGVIGQLKKYGRMHRGWLGVVIRELSSTKLRKMGLPLHTEGILVEKVSSGGPAQKAGLKTGDVLTIFGGESLKKVAQLQKLVAFTKPGTVISVRVLRRHAGGAWKPLSLRITIDGPPGELRKTGFPWLQGLGFLVGKISSREARKLGLSPGQGLRVIQIAPESVASKAGLRKGDLILKANRRTPTTPKKLDSLLERQKNRRVPLVVQRSNKILYLSLKPKR